MTISRDDHTKVKVGYVTSWRKAVFFSLIGYLLLIGFTRTISISLLGDNRITGLISLMALLIGGILFAYICFGGRKMFEDEGKLWYVDGVALYEDKKRQFQFPMENLYKIDIQPMTFRKQGEKILAYKVIFTTDQRTYYIESEFVSDQNYDQVDLYKIYLFLQEKKNEYERA